MVPGEPIYVFFAAWTQAYQAALPLRGLGLRQLFAETARRLAEHGYAIDTRRKLLSKGYLLWKLTQEVD